MTTNQRLETESGAARRLLTVAVGFVLALLGLALAAGPAAAGNVVGPQPSFSILTVGLHGTAAQSILGGRGTPLRPTASATGVAADTAATGGRSVDDVLSSLPKGKQGFVRTVPDEQTLQSTFDELTRGGTPTSWKGYDGRVFELPDSTQIGMRGTSSSGGATIDIRIPGQAVLQKIHIG